MYTVLARLVELLVRGMALAGGAVLLAVTVMIIVSITGRALSAFGLGPIEGDYELVEMGVGFAVFSFFPWCLYTRGNAQVDLFAGMFSPAFGRSIDLISDLLALCISSIIAWQLWLGLLDKKRYVETSFILKFPGWFEPVFGLEGGFQIWIGYALAFAGAAVFVIAALFCVVRSARALTGRATDPGGVAP